MNETAPAPRPFLGDASVAERRFTHRWAVNTTFTGTGLLLVVTPVTTRTIVAKAWQLVLVVKTVLAASEGISVYFVDDAAGAPGPGLCAFGKVAQPGEWRECKQDAFQGFRLATPGNSLRIGASASIGSGVIRVSGVVYGDEEEAR